MMTIQNMKFDTAPLLGALPRKRLEEMAQAGHTLKDMIRVLSKSGQNMVGQCLANQGTFYELDHYPKGDVYDDETHSQYYYHAHRPDSGEHGHFHTFLRAAGMPAGAEPVPYKGKAKRPEGKDALTHFVAVSMDRPGNPVGLFTTNRWVTDETFYPAETVISLIDKFNMDLTYPCHATNRALSALFKVFRPQIEKLLIERDKTVKQWAAMKPGIDVYEDRDLEVTSVMDIDIDRQLEAVEKALSAIRTVA
jgi:hypothetical protein